MPLIDTCHVADSLFGGLAIHTDERTGTVEVTGGRVPGVLIQRVEGAEIDPRVPIGTRRAADLRLTVGGEPATVTPAPGKFTRRSYRVDATVGELAYRMAPNSPTAGTLRRGAHDLGDLWLDPDSGEPVAVWSPQSPVCPQDAAVGYALAVAFGTGAEHALDLLLQAASGII